MPVEIQVSAWSDVTVVYCTGRAERRADLAAVTGTIERYAGWCQNLVLDLSATRMPDSSLIFGLSKSAKSARSEGTEVIVRLSPIRPAEALASLVGNVSGSPLFQPL